MHYIYCALYFFHHYINSTSDHQALDLKEWGPVPKSIPGVIFSATSGEFWG